MFWIELSDRLFRLDDIDRIVAIELYDFQFCVKGLDERKEEGFTHVVRFLNKHRANLFINMQDYLRITNSLRMSGNLI